MLSIRTKFSYVIAMFIVVSTCIGGQLQARKRKPMKFKDVASTFALLESTSSRLEMTRILADLLKKASGPEAAVITNISLGQLNPPHIGTQFNIAEKSIIKAIASFLGVDEDEIKKQAKEYGDLGLVIEQYTWKSTAELSVQKIYELLHELEGISGVGSQEEKIKKMESLFEQLDPQSAKYVVRIILGKLRLGFSDMTIVDALSWMEVGNKSLRDSIEDAYNMCADIGLIAFTLKEQGIDGIKHMKIHVGIPIRPAAAERLPTPQAIIEKIGSCIVQPKLDGFRLQIHIDKSKNKCEVHFFSRNLQDMSEMFPDLKKAIEGLDVEQLICEGEAIVYDQNTGNFLPFQETIKRKRKHDIEEVMNELPLKLFIFDILYLNGQEYLSTTHKERRIALLKLFKNNKNDVIQVIDEVHVSTVKELEHCFSQSIAAGLEGLVVKKEDSIYQPGKRNFNWIKLKRHQQGTLEDSLDCVVLGYYAGQGRRAAFGVGAFLLGVYNKAKDCFETIAKVGTGFKDPDWVELKKKCDARAVAQKPKNIECSKELYPDVWVAPEIVVIILADEITLSPLHTASKTETKLGYALRFPRFMGYSIDKSAHETTTVKEIERLYQDQYVVEKQKSIF